MLEGAMKEILYWILHLVCASIFSLSMTNQAFAYVGLALSLLVISTLIFLIFFKPNVADNRLRGGILSALLLWTPAFVFSINPDIQYNEFIFYSLATCLIIGVVGTMVFSPLMGRR